MTIDHLIKRYYLIKEAKKIGAKIKHYDSIKKIDEKIFQKYKENSEYMSKKGYSTGEAIFYDKPIPKEQLVKVAKYLGIGQQSPQERTIEFILTLTKDLRQTQKENEKLLKSKQKLNAHFMERERNFKSEISRLKKEIKQLKGGNNDK